MNLPQIVNIYANNIWQIHDLLVYLDNKYANNGNQKRQTTAYNRIYCRL